MEIRILHCTLCWGYRERALTLAKALRERFGATVEVIDGGLGQFDVRVDGRLISSRGETLLARVGPPRLPKTSEIIDAIEHEETLLQRKNLLHRASRHEFGPDDAKRFYDRFGMRQDAQFYEWAALKHLETDSAFERASAVFELGCGTGRFAERLLSSVLPENASYTGVDISSTMVAIATKRLERWKTRATITQAEGTAHLARYPEGAFDRFLAAYVLDLLPDAAIDSTLDEARRLLRADGKLCLVTLTEGSTPLSRLITWIWKRIYALSPRLVGGCRPLQVSALLAAKAWKVEHRRVVCSWGICSEVVIASR